MNLTAYTAEKDTHRRPGVIDNLRRIPFSERLIYYILFPDICARLVFEAGLGYASIDLLQQKLWIFYIIICIEYILQARIILQGRFYIDKVMLPAAFLLILCVHGFLIGIGWGNNFVKIVTDSVPLFVASMNIVLSCHTCAYKNFAFGRIEKVNIAFASIMVIVGVIAVYAGRPSVVSLGSAVTTTISMTIMGVSIWRRPILNIPILLLYLSVLIIIAQNFNRTTLVFLLIMSTILFAAKVITYPIRLYISFLLIGGIVVSTPMIIPPDSPLARRIEGLTASDVEEGKGSIGERDAESKAIDKQISRHHLLGEMLGLGHGATYEMVFSNGYAPEKYSNAHYGWALFKLRYGYIGYMYLLIFVIFLVVNVIRNARSNDDFNRIVMFLGIGGVIYIFTYMAFNIILSGLQFMHSRPTSRDMVE